MKWFLAAGLLVLPLRGATITVSPTDPPLTNAAKVEGAQCGDTVTLNQGTYSAALGNVFRIVLQQHCNAEHPLLIQAAHPAVDDSGAKTDPSNWSILDYRGAPLDAYGIPGTLSVGIPTANEVFQQQNTHVWMQIVGTFTSPTFRGQAFAGYYVQGHVVSPGVFAPGEDVAQPATGATASWTITPTGTQDLILMYGAAGTPNNHDDWVGQTSGAHYTPTSVPTYAWPANGTDVWVGRSSGAQFTPSGSPGNFGSLVPGDYTNSDLSRGAWQIYNPSCTGASDCPAYIVLDGLAILGASAWNFGPAAGVRVIDSDHITFRHGYFQQNYNGILGKWTNTLIEHNWFVGNGDWDGNNAHQVYDSDGDYTTVRYNTFLMKGTGSGDGCCIKPDGTVVDSNGGQNLHTRAWHTYIYGNWIQDGRDYEWDMMSPSCAGFLPVIPGCAAPVDNVMRQQWYGNTIVTNATPTSKLKLFVMGDPVNYFSGTMSLDAQWNTFYVRNNASQDNWTSLFELLNDTTILGQAAIHFANNVVHFVTQINSPPAQQSFFLLYPYNGNPGTPWAITGSNNYFDSNTTYTCVTLYTAQNGTCLLTAGSTGSQSVPPFTSISTLDLSPATAGAFGSADTSQTLKASYSPTGPGEFVSRAIYTDAGAIQYSIGSAPSPSVSGTGTSSSGVSR